jgi:hypothetical protein
MLFKDKAIKMTVPKKPKNALINKLCCVIEDSCEFLDSGIHQFYSKSGILLAIGILLGFLYFFYYVFTGYDSEARQTFLSYISNNIYLTYFPININSPFFIFNFSLVLLVVVIFVDVVLESSLNIVHKKILAYNESHFKLAMLLIRDDIEKLGWENNPDKVISFFDFVKRGIVFINMITSFFSNKFVTNFLKNISFTIYEKQIFKQLEAYEFFLIANKDENFGMGRYYSALIAYNNPLFQSYFKATSKGVRKVLEIDIRKAVELRVEKAEFQLAMFLIEWSGDDPVNGISYLSESSEILHKLINSDSEASNIKNLCRIALVNILKIKNETVDLRLALDILSHVDKSNKETIKKIDDEYFIKDKIKNLLDKDSTEAHRIAYYETLENMNFKGFIWHMKNENKVFKRGLVSLTYTSLSELKKEIATKLEIISEKDRFFANESEKRKISENLMAMFAHKFRGPVDSIIFNTQHQHDERIYLDAARTMTGLLEIFSIVSTEPERMVELIQGDVGGTGTPEKTITRSLKLALMQLLALRNMKRMSRYYWQNALRGSLIPEDTSFKDWCTQSNLATLEKEIQVKLEMQANALPIEQGATEVAAWMRANLINTEIQVSDVSEVKFPEYGRKEALLITIMTEVFVNAIKHADPTSAMPLSISWTETEPSFMFKCTNPSRRETRSGVSRGSGRGHSFLQILLDKMQGKFHADVYQTESSVSAEIPYQLLTGAKK